jgi:hypothetical protein
MEKPEPWRRCPDTNRSVLRTEIGHIQFAHLVPLKLFLTLRLHDDKFCCSHMRPSMTLPQETKNTSTPESFTIRTRRHRRTPGLCDFSADSDTTKGMSSKRGLQSSSASFLPTPSLPLDGTRSPCNGQQPRLLFGRPISPSLTASPRNGGSRGGFYHNRNSSFSKLIAGLFRGRLPALILFPPLIIWFHFLRSSMGPYLPLRNRTSMNGGRPARIANRDQGKRLPGTRRNSTFGLPRRNQQYEPYDSSLHPLLPESLLRKLLTLGEPGKAPRRVPVILVGGVASESSSRHQSSLAHKKATEGQAHPPEPSLRSLLLDGIDQSHYFELARTVSLDALSSKQVHIVTYRLHPNETETTPAKSASTDAEVYVVDWTLLRHDCHTLERLMMMDQREQQLQQLPSLLTRQSSATKPYLLYVDFTASAKATSCPRLNALFDEGNVKVAKRSIVGGRYWNFTKGWIERGAIISQNQKPAATEPAVVHSPLFLRKTFLDAFNSYTADQFYTKTKLAAHAKRKTVSRSQVRLDGDEFISFVIQEGRGKWDVIW